jgi:hypothetical protein
MAQFAAIDRIVSGKGIRLLRAVGFQLADGLSG